MQYIWRRQRQQQKFLLSDYFVQPDDVHISGRLQQQQVKIRWKYWKNKIAPSTYFSLALSLSAWRKKEKSGVRASERACDSAQHVKDLRNQPTNQPSVTAAAAAAAIVAIPSEAASTYWTAPPSLARPLATTTTST